MRMTFGFRAATGVDGGGPSRRLWAAELAGGGTGLPILAAGPPFRLVEEMTADGVVKEGMGNQI